MNGRWEVRENGGVHSGSGRRWRLLTAVLGVLAVSAAAGPAAAGDAESLQVPQIAGTVTDASTGAGIAGATVNAVDAHGNLAGLTSTDGDGAYAFSTLGQGPHIVTASADGYVARTRNTTVTAGSTATLDIALEPVSDPGPAPADPEPVCPDDVPAAAFSDRDTIPETHRANVDCAAEHEIVTGFDDGTYRPGWGVRRDQMASFIARSLTAAGVELPEPRPQRFADVPADSPHAEAIHRLAAAGIVEGGPGGLPEEDYGPQQGVRRDQMASFLVRAAQFAGVEDLASQDPAFTDVGPDNAHFANVNGAAEAGLAHGLGGELYGPAAGVRRDQMGTFVIRLLTTLDSGVATD